MVVRCLAVVSLVVAGSLLALCAVGCNNSEGTAAQPQATAAAKEQAEVVAGKIAIDGSSTVWPITDAVARAFVKQYPRVWARVDLSGSGRGLKKLCAGQIQIADASRAIKAKEIKALGDKGLEVIEVPVAFDGVAVVVNSENTWVDHLTVAELKRVWEHGSTVKQWSDVRPGWPKEAVKPTAPTTESGTFAYFTKAICGKEGCIRDDYFAHEDEHVMAPYVAKHKGGIAFFGYGWYLKYRKSLKLVPVQNGAEAQPVAPSIESIAAGTYIPLSRPLFVYLTTATAKLPEVERFVRYYLDNAREFVNGAGYVPLPDNVYAKIRERFEARATGSVFSGGVKVGDGIASLMR